MTRSGCSDEKGGNDKNNYKDKTAITVNNLRLCIICRCTKCRSLREAHMEKGVLSPRMAIQHMSLSSKLSRQMEIIVI
jgi:hypothetical protein